MRIDMIPIFLPGSFLLIAFLIVYAIESTIRKAIKHYVIPDLKAKGLVYKGYSSVGFLGTGDFNRLNDDRPYTPFLFNANGAPANSLYFYIYYNNGDEKKRVTTRIDTLFFFIKKVAYSNEF